MVRKTKSYLVFFQFDQYAEIKRPKDMQPAATRAPRGMEDEVTASRLAMVKKRCR